MSSNPSASTSSSNIDYGFYLFMDSGNTYMAAIESGTTHALPAGHNTYATGDELRVEYSSGYIRYYHNGVSARCVARAIGSPLYLNGVFQLNNTSIYDLEFGTGLGNANRAISGTTNLTGITWTQRGNVVVVSVNRYQPSVSTAVEITGLPTVAGNKYYLQMLADSTGLAVGGFVEYNIVSVKWGIRGTANTDIYGSFTYLTDN